MVLGNGGNIIFFLECLIHTWVLIVVHGMCIIIKNVFDNGRRKVNQLHSVIVQYSQVVVAGGG